MARKILQSRKVTNRLLIAGLVILGVAGFVANVGAVDRTYTLDDDFDEGTLVGVQHETVHDQLQLSWEITTYPIMWIANSGEDTVSKWDTENNIELARYHTWFGPPANHDSWSGPAPSRTAVDLEGNCYVANRHFDGKPADVIKILADDWIDRNGNGELDTSYDANSDGVIDPSEMLQMTDTNSNGIIDDNEIQDERVAWAVSVGDPGKLGRSLAIDMSGNIWLGLFYYQYYKLSGADGSVLAGPIDVYPNTPYGALVDTNGILWGASLGTTLLELDTNTNTVLNVHDHASYGSDYGIAIGYDDEGYTHVYQACSSPPNTYIEYNSKTKTFSNPAAVKFTALGVAVDSNGDIFASVYLYSGVGGVSKFSPDGSEIWSAPAQVSSEARGTVVDSNDDVWVIHRQANQMSKFSGSNGAPLGVFNTGLYPYTYTDATGLGLQSSVIAFGTWTVVYNSEEVETPWGMISWTSDEPEGTVCTVKVRSSIDQTNWSSWETAGNGVDLIATPDGQYLQVEAALQITAGDVSPVLYDLTVWSANEPPIADPNGPYLGAAGSPIVFDGTGSFDPDGDPIITYDWDFGDSNTGTGATPSHTYSDAGIYDVCLIVYDNIEYSEPVCTLAVVYDPSAGFVTGGGWIDSPSGAYTPDNPDDEDFTGKATFGFVAKYKKGAEAPTGNTEFQFHVADLNFHSSSYEWLVVTGSDYAKFKGAGTINGMNAPNDEPYKFMLWAGDGDPDTFRIKIWWEDSSVENVVYDNGMDQPIGGGSIVIHTSKN